MHPARLVPPRPSRRLSSLRAFHFRGLLHRVPRLPGLEASVEGRCLEAQLVQPAAASLLVALEHFLVPYSSLVPVVASFAKHPALPRGSQRRLRFTSSWRSRSCSSLTSSAVQPRTSRSSIRLLPRACWLSLPSARSCPGYAPPPPARGPLRPLRGARHPLSPRGAYRHRTSPRASPAYAVRPSR